MTSFLEGAMFTKKYLKAQPICKVTFKLSKKQTGDINTVHIVGEFNNWDAKATPMKKLKNGDFTCILDLEKDKAYQFRYLFNNQDWVNDNIADNYVPSGFPGVENSVISI